ncbi:transposase [Pseudomonas sp. SWRI179]|uniref:transposase n=1 Tax=Pseudomonas sp. SWRI179 TaxID=2745497 RepID=UPI001644EFDA|nr:transposase [Pseudomonas sp. SWRI179]MBC3387256.1 transposase [Pseudomonas sp. SWRI179]
MKLEKFIERLHTYDLSRDKTKIKKDLRQLATNRTLLSDHLHATIQRDGFLPHNLLYNAYAFVLHTDELFTVRLGFWAPVETHDESETFIYGLNHSHDFEIYAVGYSGDGYTTVSREILSDLPLQAGKQIRLGEERSVKLSPGEVIYMPALKEIHRQVAPQSMSASVSLLIHPERLIQADEAWCFDENYTPVHPGIAARETAMYVDTLSLLNPGQPDAVHLTKEVFI